jgi:hypothetical protein
MMVCIFADFTFQNVNFWNVQGFNDAFYRFLKVLLIAEFRTKKEFSFKDFSKSFPVQNLVVVKFAQKPAPFQCLLNVPLHLRLDLLCTFQHDFIIDLLMIDFLDQRSLIKNLKKVWLVLNWQKNVIKDPLLIVSFFSLVVRLFAKNFFDSFQNQVKMFLQVEIFSQFRQSLVSKYSSRVVDNCRQVIGSPQVIFDAL